MAKAQTEAKAPAASNEVYVATESGSCEIDGETYVFVKNVTRVRAGHALLRSVPDYFKAVEDAVHYDNETATSDEKRGE